MRLPTWRPAMAITRGCRLHWQIRRTETVDRLWNVWLNELPGTPYALLAAVIVSCTPSPSKSITSARESSVVPVPRTVENWKRYLALDGGGGGVVGRGAPNIARMKVTSEGDGSGKTAADNSKRWKAFSEWCGCRWSSLVGCYAVCLLNRPLQDTLMYIFLHSDGHGIDAKKFSKK